MPLRASQRGGISLCSLCSYLHDDSQEAPILPNYGVISKLRWLDGYLGLIVLIANGFGIFLVQELSDPIDLLMQLS